MTDPTAPLPRIADVGAGLMGHGIAQEFMAAGFITTLWHPDEATLTTAPDRMRQHLAQLHRAACTTPPEVTVRLASSVVDAVRDVDLVVEVIPERMELKRELLRKVEHAAPAAIFASNTSALRISEIAESAEHPQRVVGTHWGIRLTSFPCGGGPRPVHQSAHAGSDHRVAVRHRQTSRGGPQGRTRICG